MNHHVVFTRFNEMDENLKILEEFKTIAFAEFAGDPKIYKLAERCLQLCIECIIDIAHYLIAQNQWEQPLNTKEAIMALGDHGVLAELFAEVWQVFEISSCMATPASTAPSFMII